MTDTYHRSCQLGASRRRREDAEALYQCGRWTGAIYLGGYAIECALKSLICYEEGKQNFKETDTFKKGLQGASLHSLAKLLEELPQLQRTFDLDITGKYKNNWQTITSVWRSDELRYSEKSGTKNDSKKFIEAVKNIHQFLLYKQGER